MKTNSGRLYFSLLLIFIPICCLSQEGNPVLKNYFHTSDETDHLNICIRQNYNGFMLFANSKGLLSFDGQDWKLTTTANTPIVIEPDEQSEKIFAGFYKDFGYFKANNTGELIYYSTLTHQIKPDNEIQKILYNESFVYYCNEKTISQVDKHTDLTQNVWTNPPGKLFTGVFLYKNDLYVNIENEGLHLLKDKKFIPLSSGNIFSQAEILFSIPHSGESILIGSTLDELHVFDGKSLHKFQIEAESYLNANYLTDGIVVENNHIALSTLGGGYVILDKTSGKTLHIINSSTGLPDNEIYALGKDRNGGVWVSHHYGISRLDPHMPFREFSNYPGLKGNLLSTLYFENTLYVSTTEGIFYLGEDSYVSVHKTISHVETVTKEKEIQKKPFHHFLGQVFHKRKLKRQGKEIEKKITNEVPTITTKRITTGYSFKQIPGISAKCRELIPVNGGILVSSNKGLYEVKNKKSKEIIKDEYINCIYPDGINSFYIGLRHGLVHLTKKNNQWLPEKIWQEHVNVYSIAKDYQKSLWIGSNGKIFCLKVNVSQKILSKKAFHLPEFHNELITARCVHGIATFFLSDKVYYFSTAANKPLKDPSLNPHSSVYRFSASQNTITWYRSETGWKALDSEEEGKDITIPYLTFFKNIRSIHMDPEKSIWILNGNNQLFRLKLNEEISTGNFNLHIQEIKTPTGKCLPRQDLNLAHTDNSMHFFLSAPFFLDEGSVQYQYFIEGLMSDWSDWSRDNKIELTYLPVGDHVFHARARNGLGQLSDLKKISISILPPYWKSGWFFSLEVIFFFTLILSSVFLNRTNRSGFITKAITFLTLILVVEFIVYQLETIITVGNSENPLIRFGFNVMLALLISPVEKILEVAISKRRRKMAKMMLLWRKYF